MGRPERPLDPESGPVARLAWELRQLREAAGRPSYRVMAKRAHFAVTTLSDAASGERLPSLQVTLAYAEACGGDPDEWEARWHAIERDLKAAGRDDDGCPYQGMAAFEVGHADRFFGREDLVQRLLEQAERRTVVGVFGASGSGKSSLLRAGLLGTIARDAQLSARWRTLLLTPGARPLEALATAMANITGRDEQRLAAELVHDAQALDVAVRTALAGKEDNVRLLVVVDQFEETFALCGDADERSAFICALLDAAQGPGRRAVVVLGARADFLAQISEHSALVDALGGEHVLVGPPTTRQLKDIIVRPAVERGRRVEGDLLAALMVDADHQAGALPMLSHALRETWTRNAGPFLTLADYHASGGVKGAVADTAERLYAAFTAAQRTAVHRIMLRLVSFNSTGLPDTRRPVPLEELTSLTDAEAVNDVLERLAAARLITLGDTGQAEIAHEALIRAWPRLDRWLTDDRAALLIHRRLTEAAQHWLALHRDPGALYRDAPLQTALSWSQAQSDGLNRLEREFLRASEARQQAEHTVERRRIRQLRRLLAAAVILTLVAIAGTAIAVHQRGAADQARTVAEAHRLALRARSLIGTDPDLAGSLAVTAHKMSPDEETRGALISTATAARPFKVLKEDRAQAFGMAFSPDSRRLVAGDTHGVVSVWDPHAGTHVVDFTEHRDMHVAGDPPVVWETAFDASGSILASLALHRGQGHLIVRDFPAGTVRLSLRVGEVAGTMALSPDGSTAAIGTIEGSAIVVELRGGRQRVMRHGGKRVSSLAFGPGGRLAGAVKDEGVVFWDLKTGRDRLMVDDGHVESVSFHDGGLVVTREHHGVQFWTLTGERLAMDGELPRQEPWDWSVSPPADGRIAVADENGLVTVWDMKRRRQLAAYQDRLRAEALVVLLSPDGTALASSGLTGPLVVRPLGREFAGHTGPVSDVDLSPDGQTVATASGDRSVRLWTPEGRHIRTLEDHDDVVEAVAFSPDGRLLAAVTRNHQVTLWNMTTGEPDWVRRYENFGSSTDVAFRPGSSGTLVTAALGRFRLDTRIPGAKPFGTSFQLSIAVEFGPDGHHLYSSGSDGAVVRHDMITGEETVLLRTNGLTDIAISSDGALLATAGGTEVNLWDARTGAHRATLTGHEARVLTVAFSPDNRMVAAGGDGRNILLWDSRTGSRLFNLTGHEARIQALAFTSPTALISAANEPRALLWHLDSGTALTRLRSPK